MFALVNCFRRYDGLRSNLDLVLTFFNFQLLLQVLVK